MERWMERIMRKGEDCQRQTKIPIYKWYQIGIFVWR